MFVDGCFWHGHECHLFKWPKTRESFWRNKIQGNVERDRRNKVALEEDGWRIAHIWECSLKGKTKLDFNTVLDECAIWLMGDKPGLEIQGNE